MSASAMQALKRLLIAGKDDWVHFPEVIQAFGYSFCPQPNIPLILDAIVPGIHFLIEAGLMQAGDLIEQPTITRDPASKRLAFKAIQGTPGEIIDEISKRCLMLDRPITLGDVCWFANTALGDEVASKLLVFCDYDNSGDTIRNSPRNSGDTIRN